MKQIKLLTLMVCLLLCLPCTALAQTDELCDLPLAEEAWYELSGEDTILTVRLPIEDAENTSWSFLISNENVIDLLTSEVLGDEDGENPASKMWIGSFRSFAGGGSTVIQFTLTDRHGAHLETRLLDICAESNAALSVTRAVEDSFYYLSADCTTLNVALDANASTGYSWSYGLSDEDILTCAKEEYLPKEGSENMQGSGGTWTAEFRAAFEKAGRVTLTLNYARAWESVQPLKSHVIELFVNEAGLIELAGNTVSEDLFPSGRYEDGYSYITLEKKEDGTYAASISIHRLTLQDDGTGICEDGVLTITATDAAGNPMTWTITQEGNIITAAVTESTWELLPEGESLLLELDTAE